MSEIEDAARAYVEARKEMEQAASAALITTTLVKVSDAYHTLQLLVLGECYICDPGTCEGV